MCVWTDILACRHLVRGGGRGKARGCRHPSARSAGWPHTADHTLARGGAPPGDLGPMENLQGVDEGRRCSNGTRGSGHDPKCLVNTGLACGVLVELERHVKTVGQRQ